MFFLADVQMSVANPSDIDWGQGMQLPPPLLALELGESNPTLRLGNRVFWSLVINGDRPR